MTTISRRALLIGNLPLADGIYDMELVEPALARTAKPGQFVMVAINEGPEPFLRRPFSIAGIDKDQGVIRLIYQAVGKGTTHMAGWAPGRQVDLLGPLGNGYSWDENLRSAILVGGGIGTAPLLPLAQVLRSEGKTVQVFVGARSIGQIFGVRQFNDYGCLVQIATEDGSGGMKGFVTLPLEDYLVNALKNSLMPEPTEVFASDAIQADAPASGKPIPDIAPLHMIASNTDSLRVPFSSTIASSRKLFACGPTPFLQAVAGLGRRYATDAQLSMEERMGCGIGACMGCSIPTKDSAGNIVNKRVCYDGPVFDAREVYYG